MTSHRLLICNSELEILASVEPPYQPRSYYFQSCMWVGSLLLFTTTSSLQYLSCSGQVTVLCSLHSNNASAILAAVLTDRVIYGFQVLNQVELHQVAVGLFEVIVMGYLSLPQFSPHQQLQQQTSKELELSKRVSENKENHTIRVNQNSLDSSSSPSFRSLVKTLMARFDSTRISRRLLEQLDSNGYADIAYILARNSPHFEQSVKYHLALRSFHFQDAFEILQQKVNAFKEIQKKSFSPTPLPKNSDLWYQVQNFAKWSLSLGQVKLAIDCWEMINDYESLSYVYSLISNQELLQSMMTKVHRNSNRDRRLSHSLVPSHDLESSGIYLSSYYNRVLQLQRVNMECPQPTNSPSLNIPYSKIKWITTPITVQLMSASRENQPTSDPSSPADPEQTEGDKEKEKEKRKDKDQISALGPLTAPRTVHICLTSPDPIILHTELPLHEEKPTTIPSEQVKQQILVEESKDQETKIDEQKEAAQQEQEKIEQEQKEMQEIEKNFFEYFPHQDQESAKSNQRKIVVEAPSEVFPGDFIDVSTSTLLVRKSPSFTGIASKVEPKPHPESHLEDPTGQPLIDSDPQFFLNRAFNPRPLSEHEEWMDHFEICVQELEATRYQEALSHLDLAIERIGINVDKTQRKMRQLRFCVNYKLVLLIGVKLAQTTDSVRQAELSALMATIPIQKKHRLPFISNALKLNEKQGNWGLLASLIETTDHQDQELLDRCQRMKFKDSQITPAACSRCQEPCYLSDYYCKHCDSAHRNLFSALSFVLIPEPDPLYCSICDCCFSPCEAKVEDDCPICNYSTLYPRFSATASGSVDGS